MGSTNGRYYLEHRTSSGPLPDEREAFKEKSDKRQASSDKLQATSFKRQASSERSVKQQASNVGPIVKRQAWRFAMICKQS